MRGEGGRRRWEERLRGKDERKVGKRWMEGVRGRETQLWSGGEEGHGESKPI